MITLLRGIISMFEKVGLNIRHNRKKIGITQRELGKRLHVSQQMIASYENGTRIPKMETIYKIAKALEIPPSRLIMFTGDMPPGEFSNEVIEFIKQVEKQHNNEFIFQAVIAKIYDLADDGVCQFSNNALFYLPEDVYNQICKYFDDIVDLCTYLMESQHFPPGNDWTEEEKVKIDEFKEFLRAKRNAPPK